MAPLQHDRTRPVRPSCSGDGHSPTCRHARLSPEPIPYTFHIVFKCHIEHLVDRVITARRTGRLVWHQVCVCLALFRELISTPIAGQMISVIYPSAFRRASTRTLFSMADVKAFSLTSLFIINCVAVEAVTHCPAGFSALGCRASPSPRSSQAEQGVRNRPIPGLIELRRRARSSCTLKLDAGDHAVTASAARSSPAVLPWHCAGHQSTGPGSGRYTSPGRTDCSYGRRQD